MRGRDGSQRYVCYVADIVSIEPTDSPAPNSLTITSSSTEERFTFINYRKEALDTISQLLAVARGDHTLSAALGLPIDDTDLPAEPFLERRTKGRASAHTVLPLALRTGCLLAASCWRYPVRSQLSTGSPCSLLIQVPLALQNLLPTAFEWRLLAKSEGKSDSKPGRAEPLAQQELQPNHIHDFDDLDWEGKYVLQLKLPGFDWSSSIDLAPQTTSDAMASVRLRPITAGTKALRIHLHHRSSCERSRHLLQVRRRAYPFLSDSSFGVGA